MNNKAIRIMEEYRADELGLPILIKNVPVVKMDDHEVMDIDYVAIGKVLFAALIIKPFPLTGAEVRFMRLFMSLTLESLAKSLHVTHPTVLAWERYGNNPTMMTDSTEAMLRIFAAQQGAKDNELVAIILNQFFGGSIEKEAPTKCATIVELNPNHKEEMPKIHFSNKASDLRLLQEA